MEYDCGAGAPTERQICSLLGLQGASPSICLKVREPLVGRFWGSHVLASTPIAPITTFQLNRLQDQKVRYMPHVREASRSGPGHLGLVTRQEGLVPSLDLVPGLGKASRAALSSSWRIGVAAVSHFSHGPDMSPKDGRISCSKYSMRDFEARTMTRMRHMPNMSCSMVQILFTTKQIRSTEPLPMTADAFNLETWQRIPQAGILLANGNPWGQCWWGNSVSCICALGDRQAPRSFGQSRKGKGAWGGTFQCGVAHACFLVDVGRLGPDEQPPFALDVRLYESNRSFRRDIEAEAMMLAWRSNAFFASFYCPGT